MKTNKPKLGSKVQHVRGGIGVVSGYVYTENAKSPDGLPLKRDTQAFEVTWEATGVATAEWRIDLTAI